MKKILSLVALSFLLFTFTSDAAPKKKRTTAAETKRLRVIALTDLHGALDPEKVHLKDGGTLQIGGAVYLASYLKQLRKDEIPSIVIDAGDLFQGSLISNTVEGRPVVDFYNHVGLDAAAIGNHEFDYGPTGEAVIPKKITDDPRGALKDRIAQAKFTFLAANIRSENGETPTWSKPSMFIKRGGVNIGVIGAATVKTPDTTIKKNVEDLAFIDPVGPILAEARKLREQGADYVILAMHAGGGCRDNSEHKHTDLSSCDKDSEMFDILKQIPPGTLDLVVAGHTHKGVSKIVNGTPMLQSFSHGKYVAWADLGAGPTKLSAPTPVCAEVVDTAQGPNCESFAVKNVTGPGRPAQFLSATIEADEKVAALLKADFERVEGIKKEPIGITAEAEFTRSYFDENALGNMLSDVYRKHFIDQADIVLLNNGGLRANIAPGALTYGDIFSVLPFDNKLAIVTVNGATILKMIETGISRAHGGLSWSSDVSFTADACKVLSASVNGSLVEAEKTYRALTVDFLASGGSGFAKLGLKPEQITVLEDLPVMRDVMVNAMRKIKPILHPKIYFDTAKPRQDVKKICGPAQKSLPSN